MTVTIDVDLDEKGDLILAGDPPRRVKAGRSFPWSHPDRFVILRDADGEEVATIDDLAKLPARSRGAVEAWLQRHTLVPKILRVKKVKAANAATLFEVETDRGDKRIVIREREDLRPLADGRWLLRDPDGQTYELPPLEELDVGSRRELTLVL